MSLFTVENQNIKKRVRRLVKSMGWDVQPSCTWAGTRNHISEYGSPHRHPKALMALVKNS